MDKKFTLLLLGPAGSGKSAFVAGLSKLDIFEYVVAKKRGGANTTKVATTYEFSNKCDEFNIIDCIAIKDEEQEQILSNLQDLSKQEDGLKKVFEMINDNEFSKSCTNVTIQLPCKEGLIPENSLFSSIVVRDSRGFGDIDDTNNLNIDELGITYDVNAILFFSISSIQQPVVFSKIISKIMEVNLKTPMFLLRRDSDLTQNDVDFEEEIIKNISNSDKDLSKAVKEVGEYDKEYRLNKCVFNIPEVKMWKGTLNISSEQTKLQIDQYFGALKEILKYSIDMYNSLYKIIVEKMQGEYQNVFVNEVLNKLISDEAFCVAANITKKPHCKLKNKECDRDTVALSSPVKLFDEYKEIGEKPFKYELNKRGNQYADGIIPSYSYSCVNFRNIFYEIINKLVGEQRLKPLFSTFIDITLKDYTITTYTGYTFQDCEQNAFKFNKFVYVRELCTRLLKENNLVEDNQKWKDFCYTPIETKYTGSEAIAVLIYYYLIKSFNLKNTFGNYRQSKCKNECINFVENNKREDIFKQMVRN